MALSDCTLAIPSGHVVGLVGPNGAGKTTLLHLAVGLLSPSAGAISVLGRPPAADAAQLGRVGFVAQDTPTYARLRVADHLRLGVAPQPDAGTTSWPSAASTTSTSTPVSGPDRSRVASGPSWPSPSPSPSAPSC